VEEIFPLYGTPELVRDFILQSRSYATGWLGQWGELTMSQIRADPAGFPWLGYFWGRIFQRLSDSINSGSGAGADRTPPVLRSLRVTPERFAIDSQDQVSQGRSGNMPGAVADRTPPVLRSLRVTPRRFAVDRRGPLATRRRARRGATIRYRLSERATVVLAIERRSVGRRVRGRCRKATRKRRGARRCSRFRRVGGFRDRGRQGRNRIRFSARLTRRKSLRSGRYRVVARAIDSAANRSRRARASFRVVARR
jgi:hypothetical protein